MGNSHMQFDTILRSVKAEFESAPVFEFLELELGVMRIVRTPSMQKQQKTSSGK